MPNIPPSFHNFGRAQGSNSNPGPRRGQIWGSFNDAPIDIPQLTRTQTSTKTYTPSTTKTVTPTRTETVTQTKTVTQTRTKTQTPTQSRTPTGTPPPSQTRTQTQTPLPSQSPTSTPTSTQTPTQTQTRTQTPTRTSTQTRTRTQTRALTPSQTATQTPTQTQTRTQTPTQTATQTPTQTATQTPTQTRTTTQTPTQTATQTPTSSEPLPTATPTGTTTRTATPTQTRTPTQTPTQTATPGSIEQLIVNQDASSIFSAYIVTPTPTTTYTPTPTATSLLASNLVLYYDINSVYTTGPTDQYYPNVSLLAHMNGTNGSTTFVDSSSAVNTIATFSGDPAISNTQFKFNGTSGYFNTSDILTITPASVGNLSTESSFTVEFWFYADTVDATPRYIINKDGQSGVTLTAWAALVSTSGLVIHWRNSDNTYRSFSGVSVSAGQWYHVAWVRENDQFHRLYVDGVLQETVTTNLDIRDGGNHLDVGGLRSGSNYYDGYVQDFRITKGIVRYNNNFNVPLVTFYPDIYQTYDINDLTTTSIDSSLSGNVTFSYTDPKSYVWPYEVVEGTNGFSTVTNLSSLPVLNDNLTIIVWLKFDSQALQIANTLHMPVYRLLAADGDYLSLRKLPASDVTNSNSLFIDYNGTNSVIGPEITTSTGWFQAAVIISGTTMSLYINSVLAGSTTIESPRSTTESTLTVGQTWLTNPFNDFTGEIGLIKAYDIANYNAVNTDYYQNGSRFGIGVPAVTQTSTVTRTPSTGFYPANSRTWYDLTVNNNDSLFTPSSSTLVYTYGDGLSSYYEFSTNHVADFQALSGYNSLSSFSVGMWVQANSSTADSASQRLFVMDGPIGNNTNNFQIVIDPDSGNPLVFSTSGELSSIGTTNIADGAWHQIYVTVGRPIVYDQYYPNVALLIHMNGSNGSTTFTDSSSAVNTVTANDGAAISTSEYKFNGSSGVFNGGTSYLLISPFAAGDLSSQSSFTLEFWFNAIMIDTNPRSIVNKDGNSGVNLDSYGVNTINGGLAVYWRDTGGTFRGFTSVPVLTGQWYHVAWVRDNDAEHRLYVDGELQETITTNLDIRDTNYRFQIGSFLNRANSGFDGYLQDFRITKGIARYSSNFTPPTQPFYPDDYKDVNLYVDGYVSNNGNIYYSGDVTALNGGNPRPRLGGYTDLSGRLDGKYGLFKLYATEMSADAVRQNYYATYSRFKLPPLTPTPTPTS